jgi:hypothetical protein
MNEEQKKLAILQIYKEKKWLIFEHDMTRALTVWEKAEAYGRQQGKIEHETDCKSCQQRQIESEKLLNREAAYEERRLLDEVKYWKDKDYRLGGR